MSERASLCECGHPFDGSHRTPGTECAKRDCKCGRFKTARRSVPDLIALVEEFEEYLGNDKVWSRPRMDDFRERFRLFGVGMNTAISRDILAEAKRLLPGDGV